VKNVVVGRARGTEQTTMGLQVEVELDRMSDVRVDDGAGNAVARAVAFSLVLREEPNVMTFADHDDSDLRVDVQCPAGSYWTISR
jgi:hypothetical protein